MASTARAGKWLPKDYDALKRWLKKLILRAYKIKRLDDPQRITKPTFQYHTYIQELQELIESDAEIYMYFTTMFTQDPGAPDGDMGKVRSYQEMLFLIDQLMQEAPMFDEQDDMVGAPLNAIILYPMATPSGTVAFLNERVNAAFRKILDNWARFLDSPDSRYVLNQETGWLSPNALKYMDDFTSTYVIADPEDQYWGFKSWNDFFARRLQPGVRPVETAKSTSTVTSPCESTPYLLRRDVRLRDTFWIKSQPYSVQHLFNNDPLLETFGGGTIYQAFLSTFNYHRWHIPVDGTVIKAYVAKGSYYAEALSMGFDPTGDTYSQSYLTNVANRAIIFIKADNEALGLVAFVAIGMAEIANCKIDVYEGQKVKKGDDMGTFLFGGSSFVLCFEKGVPVEFVVGPIPEDPETYAAAARNDEEPELVLVNKQIARVYSQRSCR